MSYREWLCVKAAYLNLSCSWRLWVCIADLNSNQRCSIKIGVLKNFAKFTGTHLWQGLFLIKACKFIEKEALAQVLPVNFAKFVRTSCSQNTSGRLLLKWIQILHHFLYILKYHSNFNNYNICFELGRFYLFVLLVFYQFKYNH